MRARRAKALVQPLRGPSIPGNRHLRGVCDPDHAGLLLQLKTNRVLRLRGLSASSRSALNCLGIICLS